MTFHEVLVLRVTLRWFGAYAWFFVWWVVHGPCWHAARWLFDLRDGVVAAHKEPPRPPAKPPTVHLPWRWWLLAHALTFAAMVPGFVVLVVHVPIRDAVDVRVRVERRWRLPR